MVFQEHYRNGAIMISSTYPLLDAFWTAVEIIGLVLLAWLVVAVLVDVFRSSDLSGLAKAAWVIAVILLPFIGVLVYVVVRGGEMHDRGRQTYQTLDQTGPEAIARTTKPATLVEELAGLADLRARGILSKDEFDTAKAKILGFSRVGTTAG
jgi:hypothetical protein